LDFVSGVADARAAFAIDEERSAHFCEPSKDRPASYFTFGHEHGRCDGGDDQNVQVTEVVGDEKAARWDCAGGADVGLEDAEDASGGELQTQGALVGVRVIRGKPTQAHEVERCENEFRNQQSNRPMTRNGCRNKAFMPYFETAE